MKNKKLLFFFSDENCPSCAAVVPTLSRLAGELNLDFESYICSRQWSMFGAVLPTTGHSHLEGFYYLANFYDEILYCSLTANPSYQFRREVLAFGGKVISTRKPEQTLDFYLDVYSFFEKELPDSMMLLPDKRENENYYAPYCYPEIIKRDCIALNESSYSAHEAFDGKSVYSLYCDVAGAKCIDSVREGDTYGSITERIARRNYQAAKQVGFIDPGALMRWQTHFVRTGVVALYQDYEWEEFIPTVKEYADLLHNNDIIGTQIVFYKAHNVVRNNDNVIAELGKYNLVHNLVGISPRIGFTAQTQYPLPLDWLGDEQTKTPWDTEYSDEYLLERIKNKDIPVCFVFYAADLGHLPVITNFLNLMSLDGMRAGIAFPSTWYDYHPELLEQIYIPLAHGGVCPNLEPMISSVGISVATEAEGYIAPEFLQELIGRARKNIASHVGERLVPRGYYPFQDSSPFYAREAGKPQYEAVSKLGFEYYITYKNSASDPSIEYEGNGMTVLNQQSPQWFPGYGHPLQRLKGWESELLYKNNPVNYITFGFDTPFFGLTPIYMGQLEYKRLRNHWAPYTGMHYIYEAMQYVREGGGSEGKLFLVKPHELYRFVKLAEKEGLIVPKQTAKEN